MRAADDWSPERIKALRQQFGFTQEDLARRIPVTVSTVNRWENGHWQPSRLACQKLNELANGGRGGAGD